MQNKLTIRIAGQDCTILADETEEYMRDVADEAQRAIVECGGTDSFATTRTLVLSTLNMADAFLKAKRENDNLQAKMRILENENGALRTKLSAQQTVHK